MTCRWKSIETVGIFHQLLMGAKTYYKTINFVKKPRSIGGFSVFCMLQDVGSQPLVVRDGKGIHTIAAPFFITELHIVHMSRTGSHDPDAIPHQLVKNGKREIITELLGRAKETVVIQWHNAAGRGEHNDHRPDHDMRLTELQKKNGGCGINIYKSFYILCTVISEVTNRLLGDIVDHESDIGIISL